VILIVLMVGTNVGQRMSVWSYDGAQLILSAMGAHGG
jgi:hypothetical protein